jgi:hypothetical protein
VVVAPAETAADAIAEALFEWTVTVAVTIATERNLHESRLELLLDAGDAQLRSWAAAAGFHLARTWLNMSRPVAGHETEPQLRPGVVVRRVRVHDLGDSTTMPYAADLQTVHRMLEESFDDHFNSYRESFPEFVQRLREDPGHRWDHWWLAFVEVDGTQVPGGALVSTSTPAEAGAGGAGSYVDYIGVHTRARGRGPTLTALADRALRHKVLNHPDDLFFLPFELLGDLTLAEQPAWLPAAILRNRAEYFGLARGGAPEERADWDRAPLRPLP